MLGSPAEFSSYKMIGEGRGTACSLLAVKGLLLNAEIWRAPLEA